MPTPTRESAHTRTRPPDPPARGLDIGVDRLHGHLHRHRARYATLAPDADKILTREPHYQNLKEGQLRAALFDLRAAVRRKRDLTDQALVNESLAAVREAARRRLGLHAFPVQLAGALALLRGSLAEMATGEGKTLTAGIAAVLFGWTNRPCHVVTANDYLVARDAKWLTPLYDFCGVRVGHVTGDMSPEDRTTGYAADVTYATAKEVLADFLRDRLRAGTVQHASRRLIRQIINPRATGGFVLRDLHTAIVDEADSLLIDEAVTPLIISAQRPNKPLEHATTTAAEIAEKFEPETHYTTDKRYKEINFTPAGHAELDSLAGTFTGLWQHRERRQELLSLAISAREFYRRDQQYIIDDDKIVIVDEFTGRPMPNRSWQQGVHQAVEAKEGLAISDPTETTARRSFQRFFRYYQHLAGMTGTASEAASELWLTYHLPVTSIPTNRPCIRKQLPDQFFRTADEKWQAVVAEIVAMHAADRPVLAGTRSVQASEHLASLLEAENLHASVLNASRLEAEAHIVATAGQPRRITIATNMAGRGTDIKLAPGVAELGGLHVIATERHTSRRIDRQLFGRCARQGEPGSARAFVSLEDELLARYLAASQLNLLRKTFSPKLAATAVTRAQKKAESLAAKQRKSLLRSDITQEASLAFAPTPDAES